MRSVISIVVVVLFTLAPGIATGERGRESLPKPGDPRLDKLVARPWAGLLEQDGGLYTDRAKLQLKVQIQLSLVANDEVHGSGSYALTLDKKTYNSKFNIRGKLLRSSNAVELQFRYVSGDDTPKGITWCERARGTFTFFQDKSVSNGFILRGDNEDPCTGKATFEFTTTMS